MPQWWLATSSDICLMLSASQAAEAFRRGQATGTSLPVVFCPFETDTLTENLSVLYFGRYVGSFLLYSRAHLLQTCPTLFTLMAFSRLSFPDAAAAWIESPKNGTRSTRVLVDLQRLRANGWRLDRCYISSPHAHIYKSKRN
jgi:hypothetical protein